MTSRRSEGRRDRSGSRHSSSGKRSLACPNRLDARVGFGRWRGVILLLQAATERLKGAQRASAISGPVQQRDQARERSLVVRIEGNALSRRMYGRRQIALPLGLLDPVRRRPGRQLSETRALSRNPAFQLRGATRHETAVEERAAIQLQRLSGLARLAGLFECNHVTPHRGGLERDRFVTMAIQDAVTELAAEKAQRLPQGPRACAVSSSGQNSATTESRRAPAV